jgi:hypothetical protein
LTWDDVLGSLLTNAHPVQRRRPIEGAFLFDAVFAVCVLITSPPRATPPGAPIPSGIRSAARIASTVRSVAPEIWAPPSPWVPADTGRMAPGSRGHKGEAGPLRDLGATHCTESAPLPECGAQIFSVALQPVRRKVRTARTLRFRSGESRMSILRKIFKMHYSQQRIVHPIFRR